MAANQLSIANIITVSVSESPTGIGAYNTSNVAIFTADTFANSFGTAGYKIYLDVTEVATDFGTASNTYAMALGVFSQKPNILAGNGYLVIIALVVATQTFTLDGTPASGSFVMTHGSDATAAINWDDSATAMQGKLRALPGFSQVVVTGTPVSRTFEITFNGVAGAVSTLTVSANTLETSGIAAVAVTNSASTAGETYGAAITRTVGLVQYFGTMVAAIPTQADMLAAAAVVETLNKIGFTVSNNSASVEVGGYLDLLRSGNLHQTRGLYYGSVADADALVMMASYAGRGLSTNFSGSNTTQNMNLKDLIGVQPDPSMNQTLFVKCKTAGADVYASIQGVTKVLTSGANRFFDQVYNEQWLVGALQVAGFNYLAESSTKIPQTEQGMDGLKNAYRQVLQQAAANQYCAPGTWNSSTTFGNQGDFLANISQVGYYIYSTPISKQSQADREAREAPLVQIALKEAGAIDSSDVVVFVNA